MKHKKLLIIFVKNPVAGKVKTRLAATIGVQGALDIYVRLLDHTKNLSMGLSCDKVVFYADYINKDDLWGDNYFQKQLQPDGDLGARMFQAFLWGFGQGYQFISIIGSDCYQLTSEIVMSSFTLLEKHSCVLGPSLDGGYYLLGMSTPITDLFCNMPWSTPAVLDQTIKRLEALQLSYTLLDALTDVDEEKDLTTMS